MKRIFVRGDLWENTFYAIHPGIIMLGTLFYEHHLLRFRRSCSDIAAGLGMAHENETEDRVPSCHGRQMVC